MAMVAIIFWRFVYAWCLLLEALLAVVTFGFVLRMSFSMKALFSMSQARHNREFKKTRKAGDDLKDD